MRSVIILADGRAADLAGAVSRELYAELERTHSPRGDPALRCGSCAAGIFLQHGRRDRAALYGYHHSAADCPAAFTVRRAAPMSDEHKRQAEYHAVAAERAGHAADLEVATSGHTRVDVVVDGRYGIEVQRSALSKASAVDRTARSVAAGLAVVAWFTDAPGSPPWTGFVPGYRTAADPRAWTAMPLPGSVTATGLQVVEVVPCGRLGPCPHRRGMCPRWVPQLAPWLGLHVASIARYEELTGVPLGAYDAGQPRSRELRPSPRAECGRPPAPPPPRRLDVAAGWPPPPPYRVVPGRCHVPGCGETARLYAAGWLCDRHRPALSTEGAS
jgi:hypothetical protein